MSRLTLGVVMLDTRFPRLPGDIGNPATFPDLVVRYRRVPRATVARIVTAERTDAALGQAIIAAARALRADGADLIATSCGFLGGLQGELAAAVDCPVLASALSGLPELCKTVRPGASIGVLTFDSRKLRPHHFGVDAGRIVIAGIEEGTHLYPTIAEDRPVLDPASACLDALSAADRVASAATDLGAVVLECTNLAPYCADIAQRVGVPVHDITTMIDAAVRQMTRGGAAG